MGAKKLDPVHPGEILLPPQFWLGLQMDYELDVAEGMLEGRLEKEIKPMSATG